MADLVSIILLFSNYFFKFPPLVSANEDRLITTNILIPDHNKQEFLICFTYFRTIKYSLKIVITDNILRRFYLLCMKQTNSRRICSILTKTPNITRSLFLRNMAKEPWVVLPQIGAVKFWHNYFIYSLNPFQNLPQSRQIGYNISKLRHGWLEDITHKTSHVLEFLKWNFFSRVE